MKAKTTASFDVEFKTIDNMTLFVELFPDRIKYIVEGGSCDGFTETQVNELIKSLTASVARAKKLYRRVYGCTPPTPSPSSGAPEREERSP